MIRRLGRINKTHKLTVIQLVLLLIVTSPVIIQSAKATTSLSVPEFTLKYAEETNTVAPSQTTDPYTGNSSIIPGYNNTFGTIFITIKNQPVERIQFTIRTKGHFDQEWPSASFGDKDSGQYEGREYIDIQWFYPIIDGYLQRDGSSYIPVGGQIDFQVKAYIGDSYRDPATSMWCYRVSSESAWSNTQTLKIENGAIGIPDMSTTSPEPTPSLTEQPTQTPTTNMTTPTQTMVTEQAQTPTGTADQPLLQGTVAYGLTWQNMTIVILFIIATSLIVVAAFTHKRRNDKISQKTGKNFAEH
jgi:hypothetical protein